MKEKLLTILENSRSYTMAVANAMPANAFHTKIIDGSWQFDELLTHIGYGILWWDENVIKNTTTDWEPPKTPDTKAAVLQYIDDSYAVLKKTLADSETSDGFMYGFHSTIDHITHHRAQAVLFLRHQGITPPEYAY